MKISDVRVGDGLFRLNVEPTCWGEDVNRIPTPVMDEIARNVVTRLRNEQKPLGCSCGSTVRPSWATSCTCKPQPPQEPDGFDAHIDRPKRENYGGWDAEWGYQNDLKKYRKAEEAVKACDWPCREPMKGAPTTPCGCQHQHTVAPQPRCCERHAPRLNETRVRTLVDELFRELERAW